jgi:hypothetical protein
MRYLAQKEPNAILALLADFSAGRLGVGCVPDGQVISFHDSVEIPDTGMLIPQGYELGASEIENPFREWRAA